MTPTTEPLGQVQSTTIPGLNTPKLTQEQAAIIMGATGFRTMPDDDFVADLIRRDPDLKDHVQKWGVNALLQDAAINGMYGEDFDSMTSNPNAEYNTLFGQVVEVLMDHMEGPVAMWDSRVDVFIEGHLPEQVENDLIAAYRNLGTKIEFTKRPGTTKQTWITINRPDPTTDALGILVQHVAAKFKEMMVDEHPDWPILTNLFPYHLPERVEQKFIDRLHLTGIMNNQGVGYHTVKIDRVFRNKGVVNITLSR